MFSSIPHCFFNNLIAEIVNDLKDAHGTKQPLQSFKRSQ